MDVRSYNIGTSDYSKHKIQPWDIWIEYGLNPFDADIVKRILRRKEEKGITRRESRRLDYEKIIHICKERLRQLDEKTDPWFEFGDTVPGAVFEEKPNGLLIPGKKYKCKRSLKNDCEYEALTAGKYYEAITESCIKDNAGGTYITKETFEEHFEH